MDLTGKDINSITVENGHTYMYASVWSETTFTGCEILDEFSSKGSAGAVCHVYIVKATSDIITVKSHSSDPRVFLKLG